MPATVSILWTCTGCGRQQLARGSLHAFPSDSLPKGWYFASIGRDLCPICVGLEPPGVKLWGTDYERRPAAGPLLPALSEGAGRLRGVLDGD